MNFKISSFLYLHYSEKKAENWERVTIDILNSAFTQYKILVVEDREENKEVAVSFDTYIQANDEEEAKSIFLNSLKDYDVDNYTVRKAV